MSKFIIRRALGLIPLLFGIIIISFVLMKAAPGGPAQQFQRNPRVTQTQIDEWLKRWCLSADASPAAAVKEFAGWFGIYNCNTESIFSEKGGLNFLPSSLGGGGNGIIHGDFGYSIDAGPCSR